MGRTFISWNRTLFKYLSLPFNPKSVAKSLQVWTWIKNDIVIHLQTDINVLNLKHNEKSICTPYKLFDDYTKINQTHHIIIRNTIVFVKIVNYSWEN